MTIIRADVRDVVIIGSGPAGLTAAIYAARAALRPLVIEGEPSSTSDQPGGQLMLTTDIENFPGFVEGISGPLLMRNFRDQAARFGAEFVSARVSRVDITDYPFGVWIGDPDAPTSTHQTRSLVVATGARSLMLGLEAEQRLIGRGVSTCATCDGFFFRERDVAVVGGGDTALEEALFLSRFANTVTIVHRRGELRASKVMQERVHRNPSIQFFWNHTVVDLIGTGKLEAVVVESVATARRHTLPLSGLFVAIGHRPNTDLFHGVLSMDDAGYLLTTPGGTATKVPGVFACGDVQDHKFRQAITAAGSGCMAALEAERWLIESDDAAFSHVDRPALADEYEPPPADLFAHAEPQPFEPWRAARVLRPSSP